MLKTITRYWGEEVCTEDEDPVASLENFAIFAVSQFQYIILVIVFSKGAPYRESIFKNRPLLVSWDVFFFLKCNCNFESLIQVDMVILGAFSLFLTLNPDAWQVTYQSQPPNVHLFDFELDQLAGLQQLLHAFPPSG